MTPAGDPTDDPLYAKAIALVCATGGEPRTTYIQRNLAIGYNKAQAMLEQMERDGIVSGINDRGEREVLAPSAHLVSPSRSTCSQAVSPKKATPGVLLVDFLPFAFGIGMVSWFFPVSELREFSSALFGLMILYFAAATGAASFLMGMFVGGLEGGTREHYIIETQELPNTPSPFGTTTTTRVDVTHVQASDSYLTERELRRRNWHAVIFAWCLGTVSLMILALVAHVFIG